MAEIPFWFHDRPKWVSGISRTTTCQDVLHSLVRAHLQKQKQEDAAGDAKAAAQQLALVEQWRGVERPLAASSRILRLWQAWGEERDHVRFVVKRITSSDKGAPNVSGVTAEAARGSYSSLSRSRRARRRGSRASSVASGPSAREGKASSGNTVHPAALLRKHSSSTADIERLMRVILTQGETIREQLKKLQEREGQIGAIEEEVHAGREATAGKDYLLRAYLNNSCSADSSEGEGAARLAACVTSSRSSKAALTKAPTKDVPECLREMTEALSRLHDLNLRLETAEERAGDLDGQVRRELERRDDDATTAKSRSRSLERGLADDDDPSLWQELSRLRRLNEKTGREIDANRRAMASLGAALGERERLICRLERDAAGADAEGARLAVELRRARDSARLHAELMAAREEAAGGGGSCLRDPSTDLLVLGLADDDDPELRLPPLLPHLVPDDEDEELLGAAPAGIVGGILSSSQLYEHHHHHHRDPGHGFIGSSGPHAAPPGCSDSARTSATGSPGSQSSSGCGTGSEGRAAASTPDLPPLPLGDFPESLRGARTKRLAGTSAMGATNGARPRAPTATPTGGTSTGRGAAKTVDASGDLDSNSDTGLSSLHSSSDEGTYVLDTLV